MSPDDNEILTQFDKSKQEYYQDIYEALIQYEKEAEEINKEIRSLRLILQGGVE